MNSTSTTISESTLTRYQTINPATDEVLDSFPNFTDSQVQEALERAHAAFQDWKHTAISEKVALFLRMADLIERSRDTLARLATLEMGKTLAQSQGEVSIVASMFRYYADHAPQMLADQEVAVPGFSSAYTRREPIGAVLGIEPWNVPMYQAMRAAVPNLLLGNTVLLKPSEISAGSTLYFDRLFREAGFPADVYQTCLISREQVSQLISDIRIRAVTLTGSDRAGSEVGAQAGRNVKPVVLELGGSDAFIVLGSADIDKAVATAAAWRLAIGGQVCVSPKRIIVTEAVADEFIEKFTRIFSSQIVGDPFDPVVTVGPLSTKAAADSLQAQYQDAINKGATVLVPGGRMDGRGAFFRPAVLTGITEDMRIFSEEAFGPLGMIYRVPDADAAVRLANASTYGLGGTVFGEDLEEAGRIASMLDTGAVGINGFIGAPIEIPFGGTKSSGVGRELGSTGMDPFANIKTYGIA